MLMKLYSIINLQKLKPMLELEILMLKLEIMMLKLEIMMLKLEIMMTLN